MTIQLKVGFNTRQVLHCSMTAISATAVREVQFFTVLLQIFSTKAKSKQERMQKKLHINQKQKMFSDHLEMITSVHKNLIT